MWTAGQRSNYSVNRWVSRSSSDVAVDVLHRAKTPANVEITCSASSQPAATSLYADEKDRADLDPAEKLRRATQWIATQA